MRPATAREWSGTTRDRAKIQDSEKNERYKLVSKTQKMPSPDIVTHRYHPHYRPILFVVFFKQGVAR